MPKPVILPWNAAAYRQSTYEPRVYKVVGPIGDAENNRHTIGYPDDHVQHSMACRVCGHIKCSCKEHFWHCSCQLGSGCCEDCYFNRRDEEQLQQARAAGL